MLWPGLERENATIILEEDDGLLRRLEREPLVRGLVNVLPNARVEECSDGRVYAMSL